MPIFNKSSVNKTTFSYPQGRKSTVKQPRTSRRNSRRGTSQPLRRSTATWLALLIQTTFNSCSTQSQMSLSPIISVAAVSIRINIPVAEPINRHNLTLTRINTTDIYCENGGARENERLRDCQLPRERERERVSEWQRGRELLKERNRERKGKRDRKREKERERERESTPMYHRYNYQPPADTFLIFFFFCNQKYPSIVPAFSTFLLILLSGFATVFARCRALLWYCQNDISQSRSLSV